jgi:hypothetical protein
MLWAKMGIETDTTHIEGAQRVSVYLHGKQKKQALK